MKKFVLLTLASVLALAIFSSCTINSGLNSITGEGDMEMHTIDATDFTGINLGGAFDVVFRQAPEFSVELEIQSNLFAHVETEVRNNVLRIDSNRNFNTVRGNTPRLTITAPDLDSLNVRGAANADFILDADNLSIEVTGAANITLEGTANRLNITSSGAANIDAFDLIAQNANITLNGAGNIDVYAAETLDARLNGVGRIRYDGDATVNRTVAGLGRISRR